MRKRPAGGAHFRMQNLNIFTDTCIIPHICHFCHTKRNTCIATLILQQNSGVKLCGVQCGFGAYKSRLSKYTYSLVNHNAVIQRNTCKTHILNVNSGLFDTRVKILTLAPPVVPLTNMRYVVHVFQTQMWFCISR